MNLMLRLLIDENVNHRILRGLKLILPTVDYLIAQDVVPRGTEDLTCLLGLPNKTASL